MYTHTYTRARAHTQCFHHKVTWLISAKLMYCSVRRVSTSVSGKSEREIIVELCDIQPKTHSYPQQVQRCKAQDAFSRKQQNSLISWIKLTVAVKKGAEAELLCRVVAETKTGMDVLHEDEDGCTTRRRGWMYYRKLRVDVLQEDKDGCTTGRWEWMYMHGCSIFLQQHRTRVETKMNAR